LDKYNYKNLNDLFPGENTTTEFMSKKVFPRERPVQGLVQTACLPLKYAMRHTRVSIEGPGAQIMPCNERCGSVAQAVATQPPLTRLTGPIPTAQIHEGVAANLAKHGVKGSMRVKLFESHNAWASYNDVIKA